MGTLGFSGASTSPGGVDSVKDIVPTAYTPVYENTNAVDNGLATNFRKKSNWYVGLQKLCR